jgi:hypothetical protein
MHQGLEQEVIQNPGCTNAATTSTKTQDQRPSLEHKGSLEHHFRGLNSEWSHGSAGGALDSGLLDPRIC